MKFLYTLFLLPVFIFCSSPKPEDGGPIQLLQPEPSIPYDSLKKEMAAKRTALAKKYSAAASDSVRKEVIRESREYLISALTEKVFPAWYGTKWAFSGITEKPGEDYIACGYFVSTTLKHSAYKLNRYKLAQQAAALIAKSVSGPGNIKTFRTIPQVEAHMKTEREGLYVLGLDYHVGYLLKEKDTLYFIHSSYLQPRQVTRELFSVSEAVRLSDIFVTGEIFTDGNIRKWLKQEEIVVYTR